MSCTQAAGLAFVLSGTVVAIRFMGGVLPESKGIVFFFYFIPLLQKSAQRY